MGGCSFYVYNIAYSTVLFKQIIERNTANTFLLYDIAFKRLETLIDTVFPFFMFSQIQMYTVVWECDILKSTI